MDARARRRREWNGMVFLSGRSEPASKGFVRSFVRSSRAPRRARARGSAGRTLSARVAGANAARAVIEAAAVRIGRVGIVVRTRDAEW
jgi:hypothetical protein